MEWKKDTTDSEKLKLMEKEYVEAALRMMKRAGLNNADKAVEAEAAKEETLTAPSEEVHNISKEAEENGTETSIDRSEEETEEIPEEGFSEAVSDSENETEAMPEDKDAEYSENDNTDISEAPEKQEDAEEEAEKPKGGYGVYTADEILNSEGLFEAEQIIEEIKMKNETMKRLTEEQDKDPHQPRICPKCGKTIDGCT